MDAALARLAKENRHGLCAPTTPAAYYRSIYREDFSEPRRCICTQGSPRIREVSSMGEILAFSAERSDVYLHSASFFAWPRMRTLHRLYSFKIDLDHVSDDDVQLLFGSGFFGHVPTFVIRSGSGLHLDFVLSEPMECYGWRLPALKALLEAIQQHFRGHGSWRVDPTPLTQGFRVVGSRTKGGAICQAFPIGEVWNISALAAAFGVPDPMVRPAGQGQSTRARVLPFPTGGRGFYAHVRGRIVTEVREGHRELSLFALAVIGKKCGIPREAVETDIRAIFEAFAARTGEARMHEREIDKAMGGYSSRYIRTRSTKIEAWLGFAFPRATKRNGRTRTEHAAWCREIRTEREGEERRARIAEYLQAHPGASSRELSRELGMSMRTVAKYRSMETPVSTGVGGCSSSIAFNTPPLGDFVTHAAEEDLDSEPGLDLGVLHRHHHVFSSTTSSLPLEDNRSELASPHPGARSACVRQPDPVLAALRECRRRAAAAVQRECLRPCSQRLSDGERMPTLAGDPVLVALRACRHRVEAVARQLQRQHARAPSSK